TRRRARPSGELERLVADFDRRTAFRPGGLEHALELILRRRRALHAEATLGPQQAPRSRLRLRAVDEEVGELVIGAVERRGLGDEREEAAAELVEAGAGRARHAEDGDDTLVVDGEGSVRREVEFVERDNLRALVQ